ncbi:MAG: hypothetical protein WA139_01945 [Candidatus Aenigmatarchaeota archaeon]
MAEGDVMLKDGPKKEEKPVYYKPGEKEIGYEIVKIKPESGRNK